MTKLELKDACFAPHDFAITPKHFVFFQVRLRGAVPPRGIVSQLYMGKAEEPCTTLYSPGPI